MAKGITHEDLKQAVLERYSRPFWMSMTEVKDGTGFNWSRSADVVAFGLYESRGHEIHALECKASRADFLKELRAIDKAQAIGKEVDRFFIVAPKGVVKKNELPVPWGLMIVSKSDPAEANPEGKLTTRITKQAQPLRDGMSPIGRGFCASMIYRVLQRLDNYEKNSILRESIREDMRKEYDRGYDNGKKRAEVNSKRDSDEYVRLNKQVEAFQQASGIILNSYSDGAALGRAVAELVELKRNLEFPVKLNRVQNNLKSLKENVDSLSEAFKELLGGSDEDLARTSQVSLHGR